MSVQDKTPVIVANDDDPIQVNENFNTLRGEYEKRRKALDNGEIKPPEGLNDIQLAVWKKEQDEITANMISEQIKLIAIMRRTTQGPAKRGGKRAKSAPIDLDAMSDELSKMA